MPARQSAFALACNPHIIAGYAFGADVAALLTTYAEAAEPQGSYPGMRGHATENDRIRCGIPIPPALLTNLRLLGEQTGKPFDACLMRKDNAV